MNIFFLDNDPKLAAQYHNDKHVVKMVIETAQLLSTAHRFNDGEMYIDDSSGRKIKRWKLNDSRDDVVYKATHLNHPSNIWARATVGNYKWLYELFVNLCDEYTYRYGKKHLTDIKLREVLSSPPSNISSDSIEDIPQAMPDYCKMKNAVDAYRKYYLEEKASLLNYTKRNFPEWAII